MTSERMKRQIERLLDQAEEALARRDWPAVKDAASDTLALDPDNADARGFLSAAARVMVTPQPSPEDRGSLPLQAPVATLGQPDPGPSSFGNGRYAVTRFLGEGGKKRVYLAHDGCDQLMWEFLNSLF